MTATPEKLQGEFTHDFEIKAVGEEVAYKGETGIFVEGYMAVFSPKDRVNDDWRLNLQPGSPTRKALDMYFRLNPVVLFNHGADPVIGKQVIGTVVDWKVDDTGIWVKDFIQRPEPGTPLMNVYRGIKSGLYRAFSIAGTWAKNAKDTILELFDLREHSVVSVPAQGLATFSLAKSLEAAMEKAAKPVEGEARTNLEDSDFVFSDERTFPVPSPDYVRRAVNSWGRYGGKHSFEDFKRNLTALAKRKGPEYVAALPADWKDGQKMELQEALTLAQDIKAGRAISGANAAKIRAAIEALEALISDPNEDTEGEDTGMETGMMGNMPMKKPGMKSTSEAQTALKILQGVQNKMSDKAIEGAPVENSGVVTLTREQADQFKAILAERETLRLEKEATKQAELKLAEEQKAAEEAAKKEAEEKAAVEKMVEEKLAVMRTGKKMLFPSGGQVNINHGLKEWRMLDFLREGRKSDYHAHEYMQKMYETSGMKANVNETVNSQGGFLVPTQQSTEIVDILRSNSVVRALNPRVIPMSSDTLTIPRLTGSATAYWVAEAGTITGSNQTFGQIRLVAKKLTALVAVTQEMIDDSNPGVEQIIRDDMAKQLALAEDAAFLGITAPAAETPVGVLNAVGTTSFAYVTGAVSAGPEQSNLVKATAIVRSNNANPNGIVMHSRQNSYLLGVKDTAGQPVFQNIVSGYRWSEMNLNPLKANNNPNAPEVGALMGMRQVLSNQLSISATTSGTGSVIVGDWGQLIIGERQDVSFKVSDQVGFTSDLVYIKVTRRVDCALAIPSAFAIITAFPATDIA